MSEAVRISDQTQDEFEKRLNNALTRIQSKLKDKEINNIFFLTLYELPYIFSDGKIIASFVKNASEAKTRSPEGLVREEESIIIDQPLNTLHLTERVIEKDHFEEVILPKFEINAVPCRELKPDFYPNIAPKVNGIDILDYLGLSSGERKSSISIRVSLFINKIASGRLYVFFSHACIEDALQSMYGSFNKFILQLFKDDRFGHQISNIQPTPCCVRVSRKEDLVKTLNPDSCDNYLYTRDYLEDSIDRINEDIKAWLAKRVSGGKRENAQIRSVFMRTTRPDVNYYVPLLTKGMRKAILGGIRKDPDVSQYAKKDLFNDFKKYHGKLLEFNQNKWRDYINDPQRIQYFLKDPDIIGSEPIDAQVFHTELMKVGNILFDFLSGKLVDFEFSTLQNTKDYLRLLFLINSFVETTPLVAGIAYTAGKRGVPYYSVDWQDHPFSKIRKIEEEEVRYPTFMRRFFDEKILKANQFPIIINVPVICNGLTLGIFTIFPDAILREDFQKDKSVYIFELTELIERHRPDLLRSFFLDICANVTRILSGIEHTGDKVDTDSKQLPILDLKELVKKAVSLIRKTHELPRTNIIDLREKAWERGFKDLFREGSESVDALLDELKEVAERRDTTFRFIKKRGNLPVPASVGESPSMQDNVLSCKNYASYKLLDIEGWQFIVLQFNIKPEGNFSPRELNNNSYLCQAIETGIVGFKNRYEIIQHSTKAAMTAIMSRNLSHNIGSHVLSYWKNRLQDELERTCTSSSDAYRKDTDASVYTREQMVIRSSKELLEYLQLRMDFIAEISTSVPCSEMSLDFVNDIVGSLIRPIEEKYPEEKKEDISPLLQYLAHSEGINLHRRISLSADPSLSGNTRVSIPNGLIGVHAVYSLLENFIRNGAKHYGARDDASLHPYDILDLQKLNQKLNGHSEQAIQIRAKGVTASNNLGEMVNKINCLIKGGKLILKEQALQKVMGDLPEEAQKKIGMFDSLTDTEKVFINHAVLEKAFPGVISDVHFEISIDKFEKADDYFTVTMWDLRNNSCNNNIVDKLRSYLPGGEESAFTKGGRLASEGWGIKEMIICSNFLRKNTADELFENISHAESKNSSKNPPLIEIICENPVCGNNNPGSVDAACYRNGAKSGKLGIRFYLKAAKDLAIGCGCAKGRNGIFAINPLTLQGNREIPYRMLTLNRDEFNNYRNNTQAPCRIIPCSGQTELGDEAYLRLYESFIKDVLWGKNGWPPKLRRRGGAVQDFPEIAPYTADVSINPANEISFFHHFSTDDMFAGKSSGEIEKIVQHFMYLQPCSGGYSSWAKLTNLPHQPLLRKNFYLELIESALTKVVIIDERISEWANRVYRIGKNAEAETSVRAMLKKMNIWVAKLDLNEITLDHLKKNLEEANREGFYAFDRKVERGDSGCHFFVIHQGILDKLNRADKDSDISFMNKINYSCLNKINLPWKIVESGRGVPEKLERYNNVRFFEISTLQKLLENFDKHSLAQSLFATRMPPKERM